MEFNDFLQTVEPLHSEFVQRLHDALVKAGFKLKIESKAAGYFVSYAYPTTKKSAFNFYFRKNGLHVRLYPSRDSGLVTLTDYMVSEIDKQPDCKRLAKTGDCTPSCSTGYEFDLRGRRYQKCRYKAFEFLVTGESKPVISKWVEAEIIPSKWVEAEIIPSK